MCSRYEVKVLKSEKIRCTFLLMVTFIKPFFLS